MSLYVKKRKSLLRKTILGLGLFFIGSCAFLLASKIVKTIFPSGVTLSPLFPILISTLLFVMLYKPFEKFINQLFRHYFFKKKSYNHMTLMNLAEELSLLTDFREFANLVVNTFGEVFHLKTVALCIYNPSAQLFEIASACGWSVTEKRQVCLSSHSALIRYIDSSGPHVLVRGRVVRMHNWQEANALTRDFDQLRASWVIPLWIKGELIGLMSFAAESPDYTFDESDFHFFREFGQLIGRNIYNVVRYHQLEQANEQLKDKQARLVQTTKLAAIEQLATGMAHEIHNPLTIISGKAQVLLLQKDRNKLDSKVEDVLQTIVQQTKRAADITRKLLMFSQGSGSLKEGVCLEQILEDTLALISYQTSFEKIQIKKRIPRPLPPIRANIHEMREIFLNLITNAVQSISKEGTIQIDLKHDPRQEAIEIAVLDSGEGIAQEHIEKLFNPFFTTRHESIGLGLFITRQIIYRYGGSIRAESQSGKGSLFRVWLPCEPLEVPESMSEKDGREVMEHSELLNKKE